MWYRDEEGSVAENADNRPNSRKAAFCRLLLIQRSNVIVLDNSGVKLALLPPMKKCNRSITSLLLTIIYLVIVCSPLAPLAMQSKHIAHAVSGECSGDCRIDGCSLERSAAHTCCCAQKKLSARNTPRTDSRDDHQTEAPKQGGSCCGTQAPVEADTDSASVSTTSPQEKRASISSKPCGSGKLFALLALKQRSTSPTSLPKKRLPHCKVPSPLPPRIT